MSLDSSENKTIELISFEGTSYTIYSNYIKSCSLLKTALENDPYTNSLQLSIKDSEMVFIHNMLQYYKGDVPSPLEPPLRDRIFKDIVDQFSYDLVSKFIYTSDNLSKIKPEFYNLLNASNYLGFEYLLQLCCAFIADFIRDVKEEDFEKVL